MDARAVADKYIKRDGTVPAAAAVVWAPVRISDKERHWLTKAVLRGGCIPTRERDGEDAPFLSETRSMHQRGLVQGMPWRITKFGRDCLRELEVHQTKPVRTAPRETPKLVVPTAAIRRLADVEIELIQSAIAHCNGNKTHAAKALGISVRTIRNKLSGRKSTAAKTTGGTVTEQAPATPAAAT